MADLFGYVLENKIDRQAKGGVLAARDEKAARQLIRETTDYWYWTLTSIVNLTNPPAPEGEQ